MIIDFLLSNLFLNSKNCFLFKRYHYGLEENCSGKYRFKSSFPSNNIYTNSMGLRTKKDFKSFDDNKKNIFVFGDSFTFGVGLEYEKTYVGLLENEFNEYNFYNFAVPSYSPSVHLQKLLETIDQGVYPSKIILFLDLSDVLDEATRWQFNDVNKKARLKNDDIYKKNQTIDFKEKNFKILKQISSIVNTKLRYLRNKNKSTKKIKTSVQSNFTYTNLNNLNSGFWNKKKFNYSLNRIEKIFGEINKISKNLDTDLYLVIYPWSETLAYGEREFSWSNYAEKLCNNSCKLINTIPNFLDYKKDNINWMFDLYFPNDEHFNGYGNKFLYKIIKKKIF